MSFELSKASSEINRTMFELTNSRVGWQKSVSSIFSTKIAVCAQSKIGSNSFSSNFSAVPFFSFSLLIKVIEARHIAVPASSAKVKVTSISVVERYSSSN